MGPTGSDGTEGHRVPILCLKKGNSPPNLSKSGPLLPRPVNEEVDGQRDDVPYENGQGHNGHGKAGGKFHGNWQCLQRRNTNCN